MSFNPKTYLISMHQHIGDLWDQATTDNGVQIIVDSQAAAINLRMELYRYRRALEVQADENYYRNLVVSIDKHTNNEWRVKLRPRPAYNAEPLSD